MTFQAYLDNIYAKTGKTAGDFKALAEQRGLTRHGDITAWLKEDFGLGLGHARAIADVILREDEWSPGGDEQVARHFAAGKAHWRTTYDAIMSHVSDFGSDVAVSPASSYISLVREGRKFAIVKVTSKRMDIGIKLKGFPAEGRFEDAGSWNTMVTHRVRIDDPQQVDAEVIDRLRDAYVRA
jgi:hypothetical protein